MKRVDRRTTRDMSDTAPTDSEWIIVILKSNRGLQRVARAPKKGLTRAGMTLHG
jgi:hypothetical protein